MSTRSKAQTVTSSDGWSVAFDRHAPTKAGAPSVAFAHATGFCRQVWAPVIEGLTLTQHGEMVSFDFRLHGDTGMHPEQSDAHTRLSWWDLTRDVSAVTSQVESLSRKIVGVGHSMGAAALVMTEIEHPGTFSALVLAEPIVFPPLLDDPVKSPTAEVFQKRSQQLAKGALHRRSTFESLESCRTHLTRSSPHRPSIFAQWSPSALNAYLSGGFRVTEGPPPGLLEIKCRPEWESAVYSMGHHNAFQRLNEIKCPVFLLTGETSDIYPNAFTEVLVKQFSCPITHHTVPNSTHFLPMEQPWAIARSVSTALALSSKPAAHPKL